MYPLFHHNLTLSRKILTIFFKQLLFFQLHTVDNYILMQFPRLSLTDILENCLAEQNV